MMFHVILDLDKGSWMKRDEDDPLNDLQVFINAFIASSSGNQLKIVNSRRIVYDSKTDADFSVLADLLSSGDTSSLGISSQDLGYSIMDGPDSVLVFSMARENQEEYINYLKCMFVAQNRNIRIHAYSPRKNMCLRMCCEGTGGVFLENCTAKSLLSILGNQARRKDYHPINCSCCNRPVFLGLVCPICLSVYCKFLPVCRKCKTKFSFN